MEHNDGGPAFPANIVSTSGGFVSSDDVKEGGMKLRDYFAAKAMQGLLACNATYGGKESKTDLTNDAFEHADAMLKARSQP